MEKTILDCDNSLGLFTKEVDDGLALYYLLGRPEIELLGVTTTFGNAPLERVFPQTVKLLADLGREDIPVLEGANKRYQGPTAAARFLAETASSHPGELTVIATGPLGNLRGASELDPDFFSKLKGVICMGGYLHPVKVGRRDVKELNLSADPEAAFLVLNAPCPVTLMNAQICLQAPFTWKDLGRLDFWSRRTRRSVRQWLVLHAIFCGIGNFYLWDLLPAAYLSFPDLFFESRVRIGSTLADLEAGILLPRDADGLASVNMPPLIADLDRFKEILFASWRRIPA